MAITGGILLGVGTLASAGATVYGMKKQNDAQAEAKKEMAQETVKQNQLQNEALLKQSTDESNAAQAAARDSARAQMQQAARGYTGRSSTILTGPLGLPNSVSTGAERKTLLGT